MSDVNVFTVKPDGYVKSVLVFAEIRDFYSSLDR